MSLLVFLVIKPFIGAILASVVLAYLFYPLYRFLAKKTKNKNFSSLITCFIVIIILLLPLFFILNTLTKEAYVSYLTSKQKVLQVGDFLNGCDPADNPFCGLINYMGDFFNQPKVKYHLGTTIEKVTSYIIDGASNLVFSIPRFVLNFFVMLFSMFYLFKDEGHMFVNLRKILPLKDVYKKHLFERFGKVISAIIHGYIVVAIIQGIVGGIGFLIFGVSSPLIWGIVMAFAALVPFIGTGVIWLPPALIKLVNGIANNNTGQIIGGILFILYGIIIISSLDNILRPKIIGNKAKVHPVLILVGVLGGLYMLGFIGIIVGPMILALFSTFIQAYEKDKNGSK